MTVAQAWGFSIEEVLDASWKKSMVVRQRHAEEFVLNLQHPSIIVDIDAVLADYHGAFTQFAVRTGTPIPTTITANPRQYINWLSMQMPVHLFEELLELFRVSSAFVTMPVLPGAHEFLHRMRDAGLHIILLTSRPIEKYPTLYTDTVAWLHAMQLPYDFIWWGSSKAYLCLERQMGDYIRFAVDDDPKFILQYKEMGIKAYWLTDERHVREGAYAYTNGLITPITSLDHIPTPTTE